MITHYHLHQGKPDELEFELFSLEEYLKQSAHNMQRPHVHSFYQILWFTKGRGTHFVDFNSYQVKENSIFFISKGQIHYFDEHEYEGYILHFNEAFIADDENFVNIFLRHNIFHSFEKEPVFTLKEQDKKEVLNIVAQMQAEMWTPGQFAHKEYLKMLLKLFLISVQRFGVRKNCSGLSLNVPSHILFVKFRGLLEEHFRELHTVSGYAVLLHVSGKTLTNCTKEIARQTPLEIINERVVLEAKRLFSYTDKSVSEVGFELGFEDASYFVKFFKRHTGMLPGEFRKCIS